MPDSPTPAVLLASLKANTAFTPQGETVGNLTLGRGRLNGVEVFVAIVENRIASGSLGVRECDQLASLFRIVAAQKAPLLLYLDSAGARVSEGLPALGAFRHMYRAALAMALSGTQFTVLLGTHCYGGGRPPRGAGRPAGGFRHTPPGGVGRPTPPAQSTSAPRATAVPRP